MQVDIVPVVIMAAILRSVCLGHTPEIVNGLLVLLVMFILIIEEADALVVFPVFLLITGLIPVKTPLDRCREHQGLVLGRLSVRGQGQGRGRTRRRVSVSEWW